MKFKTPTAKEKITAQRNSFQAITAELSSKLIELLKTLVEAKILSVEDYAILNENGARIFGS